MVFRFLAGGYAAAGEEGITRYALDFERGSWEKEAACTLLDSPSYLLLDSARSLLYCVEELSPEGRLSVLSLKGGGFAPLRSLPAGGAHPCHICSDGRRLFVANYSSGSLAVFPLDEQGLPLPASLLRHTGRGPDPVRQAGAHVHFSQAQGGILYVCDLGMDRVFCYRPTPEGSLAPAGEPLPLPPASGPRHLCFHPQNPDWMYVVCEMGSLVCFFCRTGGEWEMEQQLSLLPAGFSGESNAAAIRITGDGRYLLASNRGEDSIALFGIGTGGRLSLRDICKTGGEMPRDFIVFQEYLVVANQGSGLLSVLRLDEGSGKLSDTGMRMQCEKPSCICPC